MPEVAFNKLDCKIVGLKRNGRCSYTQKDGVDVLYRLVFAGKPLMVDSKQLLKYLDFKSEELGIDIYADDEDSPLEVLSDGDVMTA